MFSFYSHSPDVTTVMTV